MSALQSLRLSTTRLDYAHQLVGFDILCNFRDTMWSIGLWIALQDYKEAARAILNQLLDDVTSKDSVDARDCDKCDDVAQEEGCLDGVVPLWLPKVLNFQH